MYKEPCNANGEIEEQTVVAMIVSIPILSSFSTRRILVSAFLSDLDNIAPRFLFTSGSPPNVLFNNSAPLDSKPKESPGSGVGELDRLSGGLASGLLQGVAVGVKFLSSLGVIAEEGVTAFIPRSFNIFASPRVVEKVEVEFRLLNVLGVLMPEFNALLGAVATLLPTMLGVTLV